MIIVSLLRVCLKQTTVIFKEKKSKKNKVDGKKKSNKKNETSEGWVVFCDFHEITHAVIKESTVTIYRQDNKRMVRHTNKSQRAFPVESSPIFSFLFVTKSIQPSL